MDNALYCTLHCTALHTTQYCTAHCTGLHCSIKITLLQNTLYTTVLYWTLHSTALNTTLNYTAHYTVLPLTLHSAVLHTTLLPAPTTSDTRRSIPPSPQHTDISHGHIVLDKRLPYIWPSVSFRLYVRPYVGLPVCMSVNIYVFPTV